MTRAAELKAVNCTACGAGLDVLGGGRVTVHVCPYCGTELDAVDNYRAVRKFNDIARPDSPFDIGMSGRLFGVDYTVIGTLQHREDWAGRSWTWVDHQLYSPTHGYAWLTLENQHLTVSRRYRRPVWMSEAWVERAEYRPTVSVRGQRFEYYDTCTSQITFAEGEFTWAPKKGERTTTVTALAGDEMLSFSQTGSEREVYLTTYLPVAEAEAGFATKTGLSPRGVHPLQQFKAGPNHRFVTNTGIACALICLIAAVFMEARSGDTALRATKLNMQDLPAALTLDISQSGELVRIDFQGNTLNSWSYLEIELTDSEDETVFEAGRTVEFYRGRDNEGTWSEGSNRASLAFRSDVAGPHTLHIAQAEQGNWSERSYGSKSLSALVVSARTGLSSGWWLFVLTAVFGVVSGQGILRRWLHNKRRWHGSDWTDEE